LIFFARFSGKKMAKIKMCERIALAHLHFRFFLLLSHRERIHEVEKVLSRHRQSGAAA